ncbi:hypothetical protein ABZ023_33890 [Streptomyces sp. NPDC006367]|uniref:hypothetical protein n=1 Tax=unclassified Streptomyces TaxID=2593676 RepID=UPI0033AD13F6
MSGTRCSAARGAGGPAGRMRRTAASSGPNPSNSGAGRIGDQSRTRSQDASGSTVLSTRSAPAGRTRSTPAAAGVGPSAAQVRC